MTVDISNLVLLRNDPEEAARLLEAAEQGDMDAQYAMGLIYAEGRGVEQDDALSFLWLTLASDNGDTDAITLRNIVAARMSDAEHRQALLLIDQHNSRAAEKGRGGRRTRKQNTRRH